MRALLDEIAERVVTRVAHGTPLLAPREPAPPGPRGSVVLGTLVEGWREPLALFARSVEAHGPIVRFRFGASYYLLVNSPALVHRVFVENVRNYRKSRNYEGVRRVLGDGLFTSEGDLWRRQRRLAQPAFHRDQLAGFASTMAEATRDALAGLRSRAGEVTDLAPEMSRLALRIVGRTLFGGEIADADGAIGRAVQVANAYGEQAYFLPLWAPTPGNRALREALSVFDALVADTLAARRAALAAGGRFDDLLATLMAARDEASGEGMSDRQLRDEALTLLIGGHETTATVLDWTLYLLARHPEIAARLRAHVVEVIGARDPGADDIARLGYTAQVIHEAMRLYPPAWVIEREALGEDTLGGYHVPAGSTVAVCPFVLHRDPARWPDPERFDPERFAPERMKERPRHAYLPFGHGPRTCIGNTFAVMETVIVVSMLARDLTFELAPARPVAPEPLTTLRPRGGLWLVPRVA